MATEAARLEDKELTGRKKKTDLTLAGLLMEGGMRPYLHPTGLGRLGQLGAMLRAYGDLPRRRRRGPRWPQICEESATTCRARKGKNRQPILSSAEAVW